MLATRSTLIASYRYGTFLALKLQPTALVLISNVTTRVLLSSLSIHDLCIVEPRLLLLTNRNLCNFLFNLTSIDKGFGDSLLRNWLHVSIFRLNHERFDIVANFGLRRIISAIGTLTKLQLDIDCFLSYSDVR